MITPMIRLDLGCGASKPPDFIGLDRAPIPGVDVIADLNDPLPFKTGSIDLVYASHSLEHTRSVLDVISEVFRISQDRGQICVVAPYSNQALNLANPFHHHAFNEHTPRFWTSSADTTIDSVEFTHPHAPDWGLANTDNLDINVDLRCLRMEFFYYPEYRYLDKNEQYAARKKFLDVCDQITYHLVVVKEPMNKEEMNQFASETDYYDPPHVAVRRLTERLEACNIELARAATRIRELEGQANELVRARARIDKLESQASELVRARARIDELEAQASELIRANARISELEHEADQLVSANERIRTMEAQAGELIQATARISELEVQASELAEFQRAAYSMGLELNGFRRRRALRLLDRFRMRGDLSDEVSPTFMRLRDDSFLFTPNLRGYLLQVSDNLQDVPFTSYPLELQRSGLQGILMAPVIDLPISKGDFGIEIVSPENEIVLQSATRAVKIDRKKPLLFEFAPLHDTLSGGFSLRVYVRNVDASIRLFEWRKYQLGGLGPIQTRAFCGYIFEP